jgi:tRNA-uridine 2-sulfurtransferase
MSLQVTTVPEKSGLNSLGFAKRPCDTRIVVAMSGGVDSSVVAALLKSEGYDVLGVTLQLYDHGEATRRAGACCAGQDIHDARNIAARLDIPHYVFDYEERFREHVIAPFARGYVSGETPVPCIACNQKVKFADLLDTAIDLGADALATGHYARIVHDDAGARLHRAADPARDQSYFLFATTSDQLARLRFPLGDRTKPEVRELARSFALETADKRDSQDICFVPSGRYSDVVERLEPQARRAGDVVDLRGRVLGRHDGLFRFTVGQRKGLGLPDTRRPASEAMHVVSLDPVDNRVVVGPKSALATRRIELRDLNWIGEGFAGLTGPDSIPAEGVEIAVRVRSTRPPAPALLRRENETLVVELLVDEAGVAPGQACVFYASAEPEARVLGGGFIASPARFAVSARA